MDLVMVLTPSKVNITRTHGSTTLWPIRLRTGTIEILLRPEIAPRPLAPAGTPHTSSFLLLRSATNRLSLTLFSHSVPSRVLKNLFCSHSCPERLSFTRETFVIPAMYRLILIMRSMKISSYKFNRTDTKTMMSLVNLAMSIILLKRWTRTADRILTKILTEVGFLTSALLKNHLRPVQVPLILISLGLVLRIKNR